MVDDDAANKRQRSEHPAERGTVCEDDKDVNAGKCPRRQSDTVDRKKKAAVTDISVEPQTGILLRTLESEGAV